MHEFTENILILERKTDAGVQFDIKIIDFGLSFLNE